MHKIVILITMLTIHSKPEPQIQIFFVDRKFYTCYQACIINTKQRHDTALERLLLYWVRYVEHNHNPF